MYIKGKRGYWGQKKKIIYQTSLNGLDIKNLDFLMGHGVIMRFWGSYLAKFAPFLELIRSKMDLIRIMSVFFSIFGHFLILTTNM